MTITKDAQADLCLMIVHAHPDDECFTTGGTLARYSAEGVKTVVVVATGGEEGEIVIPDMATPENFARIYHMRALELACSLAVLNVSQQERLGYRDSGMDGTEANQHPDSFHMADKTAATAHLVKLVRQHRPQVLVSYDERGGYGHPDHIACHQITMAAFEAAGDPERFPEHGAPWTPQKIYYTTFPRQAIYRAWQAMQARGLATPLDDPEFDITQFTVEDEQVTTRVAIHSYLMQKRQSIACHRSQIPRDSPFLQVPDDLVYDLLGYEYYILARSRVASPQPAADADAESSPFEEDLFAGQTHMAIIRKHVPGHAASAPPWPGQSCTHQDVSKRRVMNSSSSTMLPCTTTASPSAGGQSSKVSRKLSGVVTESVARSVAPSSRKAAR
jgi:mycothiol conjugate amidase Mca